MHRHPAAAHARSGSDVLAFWRSLGFGLPSEETPANIHAACAALSSEFEDSLVLLRAVEQDRLDEQGGSSSSYLHLEAQLNEAIRRLIASNSAAGNKRKR